MELKQLSDEQLAEFDTDDMFDERWEMITSSIAMDFPEGDFTFLDLGGGNGVFSDRLLAAYPKAKCVLLDNSELLLHRNTKNPRKETILASIEDMNEKLGDKRFDIIFINWLLHHLVADSYSKTKYNSEFAIKSSRDLLKEGGRVAVFENTCDGLVVDNLSSHLIFHLTSSKALAPITSRLGANTAGIGLCYRSKQAWLDIFDACGLRSLKTTSEKEYWDTSVMKRVILHYKGLRACFFWLSK